MNERFPVQPTTNDHSCPEVADEQLRFSSEILPLVFRDYPNLNDTLDYLMTKRGITIGDLYGKWQVLGDSDAVRTLALTSLLRNTRSLLEAKLEAKNRLNSAVADLGGR